MGSRRVKVHSSAQWQPESSWHGSVGELPQSSRTSSGHSWLTSHQEPMDGACRSSSSVLPEIEDVSRFGVRQRGTLPDNYEPYPTSAGSRPGQALRLDECDERDDGARQELSTGPSLFGSADHEEDTELIEVMTESRAYKAHIPGAGGADEALGGMMDQALLSWGIAESFDKKTWRVGLSTQRCAR
ncbi:hypothetical protein LSAT2_000110 [Lamellibrachia satsuma]|nr:hypothetical protein LSAT2_000110 [Lamellibrachia satsuma]